MTVATPHLSDPDARFAALGPRVAALAAGSIIRPASRMGNLLVLSGQVARAGSEMVATGHLGDDIDLATGQACARQCAVNLLGRMQEMLGSLRQVETVLKVTVFVASVPGFTDQHLVANGASEVLIEVLGDAGQHARSAVGVAALPNGTPVEVEAVVAVL
jgi:enamine deaminase RidA (YjgF/YER057c/UK114 family)